MRLTTATLALAGLFALSGCGQDYDLAQTGVSDDPNGTGGGPGGGDDPPDGPGGGNNPWGVMVPDSLPEAYFVVAYVDWTQAEPYAGCYGEPLHYAMIDLRGQVIAEFEPPAAEANSLDADGLWQGYSQHRTFLPAGPGQFVAVTGTDYWMDYDCAEDSGTTDWYAWRGDGVTGAVRPEATGLWTTDGYATRLVDAGRDIVHGQYGYPVSLAMQPEAPDELVLWYAEPTCATNAATEGLGDVTAVNLRDAAIEDHTWAPFEVLPSWMDAEGLAISPFATHANVDRDRTMAMGFGVTTWACDGTTPAEHWYAAYDEDRGRTWFAELPNLAWPYDVRFSALDGGAILYLPQVVDQPPQWTMVWDGVPTTGAVPESIADPRPGALLDPTGPSFLLVGANEGWTGDDLVVVHGGEEVWRIRGLKFGLDRRDVWIRDVMLIPAVAED